jgi:hypothetical protein
MKSSEPRNSGRDPHAIERDYAGILQWFVVLAFTTLVVSFALFGSGVMPAAVPADETPELWHLSAEEYTERTPFPEGWAWVAELRQADVLTFGALAVIAAATPLCFVALAIMYLRRRDYAYGIMTILVIAVLSLAASGLVGAG